MEPDENTLAGSSSRKKYKVRRVGPTDSDREYNFNMAALLFLKCINRGCQDVHMGFKTEGIGVFNDVILKIKISKSDSVSFIFQLNYNDHDKYITEEQFLETEGNLSLPEYLKNIDSLGKSIASESKHHFEDLENNIYFVLFTNNGITKSNVYNKEGIKHELSEKMLFLDRTDDPNVMFLNTGKTNKIFKVDTIKLCSSANLHGTYNYNNIFLFTNQLHVNDVEEVIENELKKLISNSAEFNTNISGIARKVINFVRNWSKGNLGGHYYLTRQDVICKITDLCLSKYDINLRREQFMIYNSTEQLNIWHQIVSKPTVTVVDSSKTASRFLIKYICSEVSKYYNGSIKAWDDQFDDDDQRSFYKSYPELKNLMFKIVGNNGKISLFAIYKCIWNMGRIPKVLKIENQNQYHNIIEILKLSNYAYKVIIVNKSKVEKSKEPIPHFETMEDLQKENRELILEQRVKIQGRSRAILGDLIDPNMLKYVRCVDIVHILSGDFTIGATLAPLSKYFIERTVTKKLIKPKALQEISGVIFFLQKHPKGSDNYLPIDQSQICEEVEVDFNNLDKNTNIVRFLDKITDEQRLKLNNINKSIYYLSVYNKNYLDCIWLEGYAKNVERFQVETECEISDFFNRSVNIISDAPGMGKSVLMDFVAESAPVTKWILKVNLNEHRQYLRGDHCASSSTKAAEHLQYFYQTSKNATTSNVELDDAIFQKLTHTKNVIVLLDGFDQVSILYKNEATNIATSLYNEDYHIWLTTRPIMKEHLEQTFMTSAISLKSFSINDQKQFMRKYFIKLKSDLVMTSKGREKIVNEFIGKLLNATQMNLNEEESKFTGIPLQTKLLRDVFKFKCKENLNTGVINLTEDFDFVYLYRSFIEKKTNILCEKYGESVMDDDLEYKDHRSLFALKTVFPINHMTYIKKELAQYINANEIQYLRLQLDGVITLSGKFEVEFLHHKFAEYLAAQWLADNMYHSDNNIREFAQGLIQKQFTGDYKFVFDIFNRILSKNCLLHTAIINKKFTDAKNIIAANSESVKEIDQGGRSVLHIIALYGDDSWHTYNDMYDLLTIIAPMHRGEVFKVELDMMNFSPLDYALANGLPQIADHLFSVLQPESINTNINITFRETFWSCCRRLGKISLFVVLLRYFVLKDLMLNKKQSSTKLTDYAVQNKHLLGRFENLTMLELTQTCNSQYKPHIVIGCDFHYEVVFGTQTSVEELLSATTSCVNKPDFDGYTPLHYAVLHGKADIVELLLSNQAIVNKQNKDGDTPLHLSLLNYNETVITTLLRRRATNANIQNKDGNTALHLYSNMQLRGQGVERTSLQQIIKLLYKQGANSKLKNWLGETALQCAIINRHYEVKKALLSAAENYTAYTPLELAVVEGQRELVQLHITNGAAINKANEDGDTPIHLALTFGDTTEIAQLLMDEGALINTANKEGHTPVHLATIQGFLKFTELLVGKGGSVKAVNKNGETPLHLALLYNHPEIAYLFIANRADLDALDQNRDSPLHLSLKFKNPDIARFLIQNKTQLNVVNKEGNMPLHLAILYKFPEIAHMLIVKDADINALDKNGNLPLHLALKSRYPDVAKFLIDNGAKLNVANKDGDTPLHLALLYKFPEIAQLLITNGGGSSALDKDGNSPLHLALMYHYPDIAKFLIDNGAKLNMTKKHGNTPLHFALRYKLPEIADLLMANGADINALDKNGNLPLHLALKSRYPDVAKFLIDNGAKLNVANKDGDTPLNFALFYKYPEIADLLIANGADVNALDNNENSPLHLALKSRYPDIAKFLIDNGAKLNVENKDGDTPLHLALLYKFPEIAHLLIANGADVNALDKDGNSPLHLALMYHYPDIAKFLIDNGAKLNVTKKHGNTPLHFALRYKLPEIADLLMANGADINALDKNGNSPLHLALESRYPDIAKFLIDNGAKLNVANKQGNTPIHFALLHNLPEIVDLLIANGADINALDNNENSPLHLALKSRYPDVAKFLIANGAKLNVANKDGDTPLHLALFYKYPEIAHLLIANGADTDALDKHGNSPLHLALKSRYPDVAKFLIANGAKLNVANKDGDTPLHLALLHELPEIARLFIVKDADINGLDNNENLPLHLALMYHYPDIAKFLIDNGAKLNVANKDGDTPLNFALFYKYPEIADLLIAKGADVNALDKNGNSLLHFALKSRYPDVAKFLIANGAKLNVANKDGDTPLHFALLYNLPEMVDLLIANGADVNTLDINGNSPLHLALMYHYPDIAKFLIANGANLNVANKQGNTPIHFALLHNLPEIVDLLIANGADINALDNNENSPLHLALKSRYPDIAKFLIANDAKLNVTNKNGSTPLKFALLYKFPEIADLLIAKGADVNALDNNGNSPLHFALRSHHLDIARFLIANDAKLNVANKDGDTPLQFALRYKLPEIADLLISKGGTLNTANEQTALRLAEKQEHTEIEEQLHLKSPQ